jgi:hypothetical protein
MGFEVEGLDTDEDVRSMDLELLDDEGDVVADGRLEFQTVVYDEEGYWGGISFRLARDFGAASLTVQAIDDEGLRSEVFAVPTWRMPQEIDAGDICDPLRARNTCGGAEICHGGEDGTPICGSPAPTCPEEWTVNEIVLDDGDEWRVDGDLTGGPNVTSGSCGGGVAQSIYAFTAPAAGTYSFLASSSAGGADTVIYARSHCGVGGDYPDAELGCSDNHGRVTALGLVRLTLDADQIVYLFVDGASRDDSTWSGPYTLVVRRLP